MTGRWIWIGVLAASGCGVVGPTQGDLDAARRTWEATGYRDYEFTFRWECFCAYTEQIKLVVRDGAVTDVVEVATGNPPTVSVGQTYPTIDELFDLIQDAIDRDAHTISAVYHETLGFPRHVFIDYQEFTADEEQGFSVFSLTSTPGGG